MGRHRIDAEACGTVSFWDLSLTVRLLFTKILDSVEVSFCVVVYLVRLASRKSTLRLILSPSVWYRTSLPPRQFLFGDPSFSRRRQREIEKPSRLEFVLHIPVHVTQPSDQSKPRAQCTYLRRTGGRGTRGAKLQGTLTTQVGGALGERQYVARDERGTMLPFGTTTGAALVTLPISVRPNIHTQCYPDWAETTDSHAPLLHVCCTMCRSRKLVPPI